MSFSMDRRQVMRAAGVAGLIAATGRAGASGGHSAPFFTQHHLPLGVQLYTLAPDLDADFDGTLARLHAMGIGIVELALFHGRTASQIRAAFDRAGLTCTSAHAALTARDASSTEVYLDTLARDMHAIGVTDVVQAIPAFPHAPKSMLGIIEAAAKMTDADWRQQAQQLNENGRALRRRDLRFCYHNHNLEFVPVGAGTALDLLLTETDPALVSFEMDAGWVAAAGHDPLDLLRRYPGRFTQMHVKDIKASTAANFAFRQDPAEVGSGKMDWPAILPAAYTAGVRRYYIEQEPPYVGPRLDAIAKSAAYLLALRTR